MPSSAWDQCTLDVDILEQIDKINDFYGDQIVHNELWGNDDVDIVDNDGGSSPRNPARINSLQSALHNTESVCRNSMETLDGILLILSGVGDAYAEVTGRTNNLMMNCERLLEQQHTLQQTVEILKSTIKPFTDIEEVACLLGIPFDGTRTNKTQSSMVTMYNGGNHGTDVQHSSNLDPRSPEFQDILSRLAKSALFLQTHFDILDKQHYCVWLERLQLRATSLVGRAMRELIEKARNDCVDIHSKKLYNKSGNTNHLTITNTAGNKAPLQLTNGIDDTPIESAPLYQKFRGLSFRLRELGALLVRGGYFANIDGSTPHPTSQSSGSQTRRNGSQTSRNSSTPHSRKASSDSDVVRPVLDEVRQGYVMVRSELLNTFMKDAWAAVLQANGAGFKHSGSGNNLSSASVADDFSALTPKQGSGASSPTPTSGAAAGGASLCMGIRQAFSTLLRVTQLEQQLFDSLFLVDSSDLRVHSASGDDFDTPSSALTPMTPRINSDTDSSEVMTIVETVSNATRDVLRPLIIRESSVDELCRVVSTLSEDVRSQMLAMPVPKLLLKQLLKGLDGTVHDAKERLSYCAETRIRQDVQMFEPVSAHLAYPEILETYTKAVSAAAAAVVTTPGSALSLSVVTDDQDSSSAAAAAAADVYTTWYPPMRFTLSLLSKLYGVVEMRVFEDFARRGVDLCVATLKTGSERVKQRSKADIHGDLFLVRHLLILREQLVPFEIRLQGTEKHLDFSSTGAAFTRFVANTQSVWRWDSTNGLLLFAKSGIPGMQETQMDAKKDLDVVLKQACFSLKQSALKLLLGPLDRFLVLVTAFAGEIPTEAPSGSSESGDGANFLAAGGSHVPLLSVEARANLKNQAIVKPERIKEMLESAQSSLGQSVPELRAIMKLYIENQVARTILIRPILQEFGVCQRKLESVVASCLDPGQTRRDLETLLQTIAYTVVAELSQ